jgi:hypothetical protein
MSDYTFPLSFFTGDLYTPYSLATSTAAAVEPSISSPALVHCYVISATRFCVNSLSFNRILYALICEAFLGIA